MGNRDIDSIVDYRAEYSAVIQRATINGARLVGRCPFHNDSKNSFSADLKTGKWKCFSEDSGGNFITFWSKLYGVDHKDAYMEILKKYHAWEEEPPKKEEKKQLGAYSLEQYARDKKLPEDFLGSLGVCDEELRGGTKCLKIPYYNEGGTEPIFRRRFADKEFRWSRGSSGRLILYGDWRLPEIRAGGKVILVEGESDTQTLWHLGLPAVGAPGASNIKPEHAKKLDGLKVYMHVEPDGGGQTFRRKCLEGFKEAGFDGELYEWSCGGLGVKDPSALFMAQGADRARELIFQAIGNAKRLPITVQEAVEAAWANNDGLTDPPVSLRIPNEWGLSDNGIFQAGKDGLELVCRTPILITRRIVSIEGMDEKTEVAFRRDGVWRRASLIRSELFSTKGIIQLANCGCTITSENARRVVSYMQALEAENLANLPKAEATSVLGWLPGKKFMPGHAGNTVLDVEPSLQTWADGYQPRGSADAWASCIGKYRKNDKFRFMVAASFAAPLLQILHQRVFLVYNWGESRSGKTAALKAAISAWGDPDRLVANFNATQVAIERMAGFYHDLPMGIDERQLAGSKQEALEKLVYMLGSGTGRARGTKSGGLQQLSSWQTIVLATGEEPIATGTSQAGVSTRTIEISDGPFKNKEKEAAGLYQEISSHHGWAGPDFIGHVLCAKEEWLRNEYLKMLEEVQTQAGNENYSHVASISVCALADALAEAWIFRDGSGESIPQDAWDRAVRMAGAILDEQRRADISDANESAAQFVVDWILSNAKFFGHATPGTCYGEIDEGWVYIYPSIFKAALEKNGYSYRKTMKYLDGQGLTEGSESKDGKKFTVVRKTENRAVRMIKFSLDKCLGTEGGESDVDEDFRPLTQEEEEALPYS